MYGPEIISSWVNNINENNVLSQWENSTWLVIKENNKTKFLLAGDGYLISELKEKTKKETNDNSFPSIGLLVSLYSIGGLITLLISFDPNLETEKSVYCLITSFILSGIGLWISSFVKIKEIEENQL